jgi:hypothetical protein
MPKKIDPLMSDQIFWASRFRESCPGGCQRPPLEKSSAIFQSEITEQNHSATLFAMATNIQIEG